MAKMSERLPDGTRRHIRDPFVVGSSATVCQKWEAFSLLLYDSVQSECYVISVIKSNNSATIVSDLDLHFGSLFIDLLPSPLVAVKELTLSVCVRTPYPTYRSQHKSR